MNENDSQSRINDECYCGSKKNFMDCHSKLEMDYYPKAYFTAKVLGIENVKFENRSPDKIEVGRIDVSYRNPLPWDNELDTVLIPLTRETWNTNDKWENLIEHRKNKLAHKLLILRHHIEDFKQIEKLSYDEYVNGIVGNTTMNRIFENPLLISNTESFLFQAKSTLDVFAQLIGIAFKFTVHSYSEDGQKIMAKLKSNDCDKYRNAADNLIQILDDSRQWVKKLVEMRDDITHYSDLPGLSCFIFRKIEISDSQATVYYPSLSDGERVSAYMDKTWTNISNLISSSLPIMVKLIKNRR